jgi:hypothetical protein
LSFEVDELDTLGAAAGGSDGLSVDGDDLAERRMTVNFAVSSTRFSLVSSTRLMLETLAILGVAS